MHATLLRLRYEAFRTSSRQKATSGGSPPLKHPSFKNLIKELQKKDNPSSDSKNHNNDDFFGTVSLVLNARHNLGIMIRMNGTNKINDEKRPSKKNIEDFGIRRVCERLEAVN